ncbi:hypothetical protein GCM10027052_01460 [Parafrigoribacterium mesophilum]
MQRLDQPPGEFVDMVGAMLQLTAGQDGAGGIHQAEPHVTGADVRDGDETQAGIQRQGPRVSAATIIAALPKVIGLQKLFDAGGDGARGQPGELHETGP